MLSVSGKYESVNERNHRGKQ